MKNPVLGLACLASLAATAGAEEEYQLQQGPDDLRVSLELLNTHYDQGVAVHDDVTAHSNVTIRHWDIGLHLDGWMAVDGNDRRTWGPTVSTGEVTQFTARLDYLIEMEGFFQLLPHFETTLYPDTSGATRYNWLGADAWYLLPIEGFEIGGSADYNLRDDTPGNRNTHAWRGSFGAREFFQDAPLDFAAWQMLNLGSASYHRNLTGTDNHSVTTLNLGGRVTLPFPFEDTWTYLQVEGSWWLDGDDRDALRAQGREAVEVLLTIGLEYHPE